MTWHELRDILIAIAFMAALMSMGAAAAIYGDSWVYYAHWLRDVLVAK
jgi:hypothetical protein